MIRRGFPHIYGPVPSRRLGRSLGVDLVGFKTCSYDCIYCQLGRTTNLTIDRKEHVPVDDILDELKEKLASEPRFDYVGIAGSGEPTLYSRLGELIVAIKGITDTPVAILTNGSLLWIPGVQEALMEADLILPSLDAGDERLFQSINRPHQDISFDAMVDGIATFTSHFSGEVWLEVFLLGGRSALPSEATKIAELARYIAPSRVQLNTIHRPPAECFALSISQSLLEKTKKLFTGRVDIISKAERIARPSSLPTSVQEENCLALISRRPCSAQDVAIGLGIHVNEALKYLEHLTAVGKASIRFSGGLSFYVADHDVNSGIKARYR